MTTGDVKNNLRKLVVELKKSRYPITEVNVKGLSLGTPTAFLPILHYIFLDFSVDLTEFFAKDYELYGKTDLRFMETVYKILRDVFHYKPPLTREQFLAIGYAERKIIQLCDIIRKCREKSLQLNPKSTKVDKKYSSKAKPQIYDHEKKGEVVNVQSKSGQTTNWPCGSFEVQETNEFDGSIGVKGLNNPAKSALKVRKDENKENRELGSLSLNERKREMGKLDGIMQPYSRQRNGIKNVRWEEDENVDTIRSVPVVQHSNSAYASFSNSEPVNKGAAIPLPPRVTPAPVSMTMAPEPSPDLMLTPMTKGGHQAIPLSGLRHEGNIRHVPTPLSNVITPSKGSEITDVSLVDLTDSVSVTQPKIVRHNMMEQASLHGQLPTKVPQDGELKSLRVVVTEMQEKLDAAMAQNNEMSARIVLLENKVKLLEESSKGNTCENCSKNNFVSKSSQQLLSRPTIINDSLHQGRLIINGNLTLRPGYESEPSPSSRRHLLGDFNESQNTTVSEPNKKSLQSQIHGEYVERTSQSIIEISDDELDTVVNQSKSTPSNSPARQQDVQKLEAISPLCTSSDIHLKFSDPTTTATILNVERRLKETRAMLANATKLPQAHAF